MVRDFNAPDRLRRAIVGLVLAWGAAVASVSIPIAHFLLVPSFSIGGLYLFFTRLRTGMIVATACGPCPDCGTEQDFGMRGKHDIPSQVQCESCRRVVTVSLSEE